MKREEVYKRIDGERDYQDRKWGGREHDETHKVEKWIYYMRGALEKAYNAEYDYDSEKALDELRQVVALGIACFEVHGVPQRINILPENYV